MHVLPVENIYRLILPNVYFFTDVFKFLMHKVTISDAPAALDHYNIINHRQFKSHLRPAITICILENYVLPPIKLSVNNDNLS